MTADDVTLSFSNPTVGEQQIIDRSFAEPIVEPIVEPSRLITLGGPVRQTKLARTPSLRRERPPAEKYAVGMSANASPGDPGPRATLAEVAALADVSISTVSKVLNGRNGVSEETRARVELLLQNHQYNRRSAGPNQAPLMEVLCFEIDSAWAAEAIAAIERVAREHGVGLVVSGTNDRHKPDLAWIEGVINRRPVGVILIVANLLDAQKQQLHARNIRFVTLDPAGQPAADVPSIGSADWSGAYAATKHLVDLGHREIAIITGPDDMMAAIARLSGFTAALEAARIPLPSEYVRRGEFHHADGVSEGRVLLSLPVAPTAIFASSDVQALGVYESARALGYAIPSELSVVGFDDLNIARWAGPALTTVHVPIAEMAEQAAQVVLGLWQERGQVFGRIDMATTLIVRGSTAPPPSRTERSFATTLET